MSGWNFADVWETVAGQVGDAPAVVHAGRPTTWAEFDGRADGIGWALLDAGLGHQDRVALYLYNGPAYLESTLAAFKVGMVPVNTNYRYGGDELAYLWTDAGAAAVVFSGCFTTTIAAARPRVPSVRAWLWVDDGTDACPDWAQPYDEAAATGAPRGRAIAPWGRDGDDLLLLYTGGTTGLPKGVMWRQDDLFVNLNQRGPLPFTVDADLAVVRDRVSGPNRRLLAAAPLMHGAGLLPALSHLAVGGSVVTLAGRRLDGTELLDAITRDAVNTVVWVGDAFAKPVLRALDAHPGRWDLTSLTTIVSGGVAFSAATKAGLLRHNPGLVIVDVLASSEAFGLGDSVTANGESGPPRFILGPHARVIGADWRDVVPGSGEIGHLAVGGRQPLGYWNDLDKTASAFHVIDGVRYAIPGDWATVEEDGTLTLLGRGSACINTGGEKVFPEEVEQALKEHPGVADVVVVGLPDDGFGEAVTAVVEPEPGADIDLASVATYIKARLAGYKAPRHLVVVDTIGRGPNGKADLRGLKALAAQRLGVST